MPSLINPSNIDGTYPIAGQDNDSQGFRDNFNNTKTNFTTAQDEIGDLQGKVILKSALKNSTLDNNMTYEKIIHPQLQAYSETYYNVGTVSGSQSLSYDNGNVQQITTGGSVLLGFTNWPAAGQCGKIQFWITVTDVTRTLTLPASCTIGFPSRFTGASVNADLSITITFADIGHYFYEFMSIDGAVNVAVTELNRDVTLASVEWLNIYNKPTFANVATTGSYYDLLERPIGSTVATTGSYSDLVNTPTFANVATTGSYASLTNKPVIPTAVSALSNDSGYITSTGNAATASKLATARLINGVSFDGSANITTPENMLASDLTGNVLSANVVSSSLTSVGTLSNLTVGGDTHLNLRVIVSSQLLAPSSGQTIQFNGSAVSIVRTGSTLAALTIIMPPAPTNNQILTVGFVDPVTAITISAPSAVVLGGMTGASANSFFKWIYIASFSAWVRIG